MSLQKFNYEKAQREENNKADDEKVGLTFLNILQMILVTIMGILHI